MQPSFIVPHSEPFLLPGNKIGCILIHGFTAMPEEVRYLGEYLHGQGHTVLGPRLAGHATHPRDLARTLWTDWLVSVEEGLALLKNLTDRVFLIGLSMGGMVSLTAAARYPVAGVIALSTPFIYFNHVQIAEIRKNSRRRKPVPKNTDTHPGLGIRREANYPAYAATPPNIYWQVNELQAAMETNLPKITCPVLVIQSHHDPFIPPDSLDQIAARLNTSRIQTLWLDHFEHAIVRDPRRDIAFESINEFIREHTV
jgi:carboxylesterase